MQLRSGREGRGFDPRRLDQNSRITIGGTAVFDSTACDGERGWEPFCGSKTLCLTKLGLWKTWRQRTTLITSERGAPLKAQIPSPRPKIADSLPTIRYFLLRVLSENKRLSAIFIIRQSVDHFYSKNMHSPIVRQIDFVSQYPLSVIFTVYFESNFINYYTQGQHI